MSELKGLRDDVYRRPLATALSRLGLGPGWRCVDVGAGGGDVSVALAEMVGRGGRVYAVDSDPLARDEVARAAAAHAQVLAVTQAAEDLTLPEPVDLAFCRFLLLHVLDPLAVVRRTGGPGRGRGPARPGSSPSPRRWPATRGSSCSTPGPRRRPGWDRDR